MKKYFKWLEESNRKAHVQMGMIIFILTLMFSMTVSCVVIGNLEISQLLADRMMTAQMIQADWCVLGCMASVEFIQQSAGGRFDWADVAAGCLCPLAMTAVIWAVIAVA